MLNGRSNRHACGSGRPRIGGSPRPCHPVAKLKLHIVVDATAIPAVPADTATERVTTPTGGQTRRGFTQTATDGNGFPIRDPDSSIYDTTIPTRVIAVDEDTQGDEGTETNGEVLLTRFKVDGEGDDAVHGDEVELDLENALTTGRTVTEAPESD